MLHLLSKYKISIFLFVASFILVEVLQILAFAYTEVVANSTTKEFWIAVSNIVYLPASSIMGPFFQQEPFVIPNALLVNPILWGLLVTLVFHAAIFFKKQLLENQTT